MCRILRIIWGKFNTPRGRCGERAAMFDLGRSFEECGLGVALLSLEVDHDRVVLSLDRTEHRLWMVDVQGDSTGAVPVHGDYQETRVSKRRVLGDLAPASATSASLRNEDGNLQAGPLHHCVSLPPAPPRHRQVTLWDHAGMPL